MKNLVKRMKTNWVGLTIMLLALVLRLPLLNGSFWLDEAAQAMESVRPLDQQLQIRGDFQPPLIHLMVHEMLQISEQEWFLRTGAALIPGLITIAAMLWIGKILHRERIAELAAFFLATSSFHIFYSQELRPYSLPAMFAVLGWGVVLKLSEQKSKSLLWPVVFVVCSIFGLYSSYLYPFALFGQVVYLLWVFRKNWKKLGEVFASCFLIGLGFLPWLPSFLDQLKAGQQLRVDFPGWQEIVSFGQFKSIALVAGKFIFGILDLSATPFFIVTLLAIACSAGLLKWMIWQKRLKNETFQKFLPLLVCWILLPVLTAWLISFVVPVVQPKRVLFALPAFYLGVSWLILEGFETAKKLHNFFVYRIAAAVLGVLLLSINIFSTFSYYTNPKYQREDWRSMHRYITEKYLSHESAVVFGFPEVFASWAWYNRTTNYPTVITGVFVVSKDPDAKDRQALKALTRYHYILVFDYLLDLSDKDRLIQQDLERYGYTEVDRITPKTPLGIVHVYAQSRQIIGSATYSDGK